MKNWQLSRRHMLRGMGATMSLPFLEAMIHPGEASAAGAAGPNGEPVRFAAFFMPNGVNHEQFDPKGSSLSKLPPILAPLGEMTESVNVITGLNNADGGHAAGTSAFLTGRRPKKTGKPSEVNVGNPSIDQMIGQAFKEETLLPTLELGLSTPRSGVGMSGHSHVYTSFIGWKAAGTPVPHEINPMRAFDRLFKGASVTTSGMSRSREQKGVRPDKSVLDIVLEDAKSLQKQLGRSDQQKLDEYLTAVRDVEERIQSQVQAAKGLRITDEVLKEIKSVGSDIRKASGDSRSGSYSARPNIPYREHGRLMMDVMALAFWSNSTRAATLMFGDGLHGRNMSFLEGVDGNHHSISHHGNKKGPLETFAKVNTFFVDQYAYFLRRLRNMSEGSSNVLENSVVLFGSNISSGQVHNGNNIPVILSGGAGGRLRGGRHIEGRGEEIGSLHRSILDLMEVKGSIGDGSGKVRGI
ncbi:MAG: DUF1552 domain-containing protein [Verrucomicrobiota bacterium]